MDQRVYPTIRLVPQTAATAPSAHVVEEGAACAVGGAERPVSRRYNYRMVALLGVHLYIIVHMSLWYFFDVQIWGKTAMMGVPSLMKGTLNAASIMVMLILFSVFLFGRGFCGWVCHMRGAIELADWLLRKLKVARYERLRSRNVLLNTRFRWMLRLGTLFFLLLPVIVLLYRAGFTPRVDVMSPPPMADLPGYNGKLFTESAPLDVSIALTLNDVLLAFGAFLFIQFMMSVVMNLFYGQGAFCRILCPYAPMLAAVMNLSPWQQRITRVDDCCGCRDCSRACPQGIDVSREIYNFNGKVTNRECIKCYNCIDACTHGVLRDTAAPAVAQGKPIPAYEKRPWQKEGANKEGLLINARHMQLTEPIAYGPDFASIILALLGGAMSSRLGGFWFYPGAIVSYIVFRWLFRRMFAPGR